MKTKVTSLMGHPFLFVIQGAKNLITSIFKESQINGLKKSIFHFHVWVPSLNFEKKLILFKLPLKMSDHC